MTHRCISIVYLNNDFHVVVSTKMVYSNKMYQVKYSRAIVNTKLGLLSAIDFIMRKTICCISSAQGI